MRRIFTFFFLFIVGISNAQALDFPISRPNVNEGATKVWVSYFIIDIEDIDNKGQSFTLDMIIRLKWNDPRLPGSEALIPLNSIWNPNVQIFNLRDVQTRFQEKVSVNSDGIVEYKQRYYATLSSPLDFKDFPFDIQTLPVSLMAFGFTPDEVELVFETAGNADKYSISGWDIVPIGAKNTDVKASLFNDSSEEIIRPKLDYSFQATRYIHYYWWKVLAPLMVILFLSWAVFWIDPSQVGAQIGVSGTSILTLIAFLLRLENFLPPVSYLTHMDHFVFTSLVLVFFAYVEALISTTYALKGKLKFAHKLDMTFRIMYPLIFAIVIFIYWVK